MTARRLRLGIGAAIVLAAAAAAAAALGAGTGPRGAATTSPLDVDNPYWSGYVVTGPDQTVVSYTSVTGTWTVPAVTCTRADAGASSAIWVGLGGYTSRVLEQVGVNMNCDANGKPLYFAWHEIVPDIARNITAKVEPGDTITGSVRMVNPALVELRVANRTRHWMFSQRITWATADLSSAEWIMEAPQNCHRNSCHQARLANFGSVRMTGIRATGNSSSGTLSNPDWTATSIRLVPAMPGASRAGRPVAGATAGRPTTDGGTFEVSWVQDASGG